MNHYNSSNIYQPKSDNLTDSNAQIGITRQQPQNMYDHTYMQQQYQYNATQPNNNVNINNTYNSNYSGTNYSLGQNNQNQTPRQGSKSNIQQYDQREKSPMYQQNGYQQQQSQYSQYDKSPKQNYGNSNNQNIQPNLSNNQFKQYGINNQSAGMVGNKNPSLQNSGMGNFKPSLNKQPSMKQQTSKSPVNRQPSQSTNIQQNYNTNEGMYGGYNNNNGVQQQQQKHFGQESQHQFHQQSTRLNTYQEQRDLRTNDAQQMYMGYNNPNGRHVHTQPNPNNTLDSFTGITGSILDEGVNTNMPMSKAITGSKQPLSRTPNRGNSPFMQQPMMQPGFFSNYEQNSQNRSHTPKGINKPVNQQYSINSQRSYGQQSSQTQQEIASSQAEDPNPYLIRNKDTGEVYDIREYNKIRDEDQAVDFLQNKQNSYNSDNISQNNKDSIKNLQNSQYNYNSPQIVQQIQQQQFQHQQHIQEQLQNKYLQQQQQSISNSEMSTPQSTNKEKPRTNNFNTLQKNNSNNVRQGMLQQRAHSPYIGGNGNAKLSNNIVGQNQTNPSKSLSPAPNQQAAVYQQQQQQYQQNNNQSNNNSISWQQLISPLTKINRELLLMAKVNNQEKCIELLDKKRGDKKAEVNAIGEDGWTALHFATLNGNSNLVSFLLYHSAVIDCLTNQSQSPLHIAAQKGHDIILQILINAGADINFQDINGDSALHHAAKSGHKIIVEILLKKPSLNIKLQNKKQQEAYELSQNENIKKAFDDFLQFKQSLMQNHPKLQIYNTQQEKVAKMFNSKPQENAQNKLNTDLHHKYSNSTNNVNNNQNGKHHNKLSINSENTTDENSGAGSFNNEEKVGPQSFNVHGLIGKGSFGEVYLVEKKTNNILYAMKVLHKNKIMKHNLTRYALTERNVLSLTNHPFIVKMQFAFQTSDKLFLILDYCPGGDLGELLQKEKKFSEDRVRLYLCEIILALEDLHKRDVIFRDLKPDNIVLDHQGHAKLTDFGLSKEGILDHNTGARSFCGSVAYLAPEMLKRCGHGKAVDWYLLGVVMYEFLVGIPPYYANNREELFYNIEKAPLKLPNSLTQEAKSLLKGLLQRNPAKRLGSGKGDAEEIKNHKFFTGVNWNEVYNKKLKPPLPKRKIRISTKFDPNIFESSGNVDPDKQKIVGWSFVAPQNYSN